MRADDQKLTDKLSIVLLRTRERAVTRMEVSLDSSGREKRYALLYQLTENGIHIGKFWSIAYPMYRPACLLIHLYLEHIAASRHAA